MGRPNLLLNRVLVGLFLCVGTILAPRVSLGQAPAAAASTEDDRIVDQVRLRLAGDADVKGGNIEVTSKDGEVVLKGKVENEKGKLKASKLAKKVKGVKTVDNQLTIDPLA